MANAIAWIFEALLRLLLPPSGRHRAAPHQHTPTMPPPARVPHAPARPTASGPPYDHSFAMVRPYVIAHEQREERAARRLRRQRRRTLWLAVHGIDIGPRVIHGVRVVA
ncbi:hypothetical protein [Streptomyces sp. ME19-01-6]|uniref:hypothetical protein n=1 Tax=Streptomyces sp. ME19-01-6 TaxID=3028686 RepID=UPI0029B6396F|nr:hypothetical protein [Streptomyces sp. ME19-01-6]MDX3233234.1 hypothetical protein [Streptomyces sp. ME19-01-6]